MGAPHTYGKVVVLASPTQVRTKSRTCPKRAPNHPTTRVLAREALNIHHMHGIRVGSGRSEPLEGDRWGTLWGPAGRHAPALRGDLLEAPDHVYRWVYDQKRLSYARSVLGRDFARPVPHLWVFHNSPQSTVPGEWRGGTVCQNRDLKVHVLGFGIGAGRRMYVSKSFGARWRAEEKKSLAPPPCTQPKLEDMHLQIPILANCSPLFHAEWCSVA